MAVGMATLPLNSAVAIAAEVDCLVAAP
jgi:hypothetical protein